MIRAGLFTAMLASDNTSSAVLALGHYLSKPWLAEDSSKVSAQATSLSWQPIFPESNWLRAIIILVKVAAFICTSLRSHMSCALGSRLEGIRRPQMLNSSFSVSHTMAHPLTKTIRPRTCCCLKASMLHMPVRKCLLIWTLSSLWIFKNKPKTVALFSWL